MVAVQDRAGERILRAVHAFEHHRVVHARPFVHRPRDERADFVAVVELVCVFENSRLIGVAHAGNAGVSPEVLGGEIRENLGVGPLEDVTHRAEFAGVFDARLTGAFVGEVPPMPPGHQCC